MDPKKEKEKKQIPLRVSAALWEALVIWAEEDFRSLNGQVEYLLTECVKNRKKGRTQNNDVTSNTNTNSISKE